MSILDSSRTGDKSEAQKKAEKALSSIEIEKSLEESLVFGRNSNLGSTIERCGELKTKPIGVKKSSHKPQVALLDIQFPKALRAISQASMAGHEKYKETDQDYKNFKRVPDAENQYRNASRRHELDREDSYIDQDTGIPHIVLKAWNVLAELEIHLENKANEKNR